MEVKREHMVLRRREGAAMDDPAMVALKTIRDAVDAWVRDESQEKQSAALVLADVGRIAREAVETIEPA